MAMEIFLFQWNYLHVQGFVPKLFLCKFGVLVGEGIVGRIFNVTIDLGVLLSAVTTGGSVECMDFVINPGPMIGKPSFDPLERVFQPPTPITPKRLTNKHAKCDHYV